MGDVTRWVHDEVAHDFMTGQVRQAFQLLREVLVRGDENMKARQLLDCVPFWMWDDPVLAQAREAQRAMTEHAVDPVAYEAYYASNPHDAPMEQNYPGVTVDNALQAFPRLAWAAERLNAEVHFDAEARVIDLSGNDGLMAVALRNAPIGVVVDVQLLDLDGRCVERAKARGVKAAQGDFRDGCGMEVRRIFNPDIQRAAFDVAILFETIEHVPDPVGALRQALTWAPVLYVSTPVGAVERLRLPTWAYIEPKGHLHSWTPTQFQEICREAGEVTDFEILEDGTMVARLER